MSCVLPLLAAPFSRVCGNLLAECHLCTAIAVCFAIWLCVICLLQCCVLYSRAVCHPLIAILACFKLLAVSQSYCANTPKDTLRGEYCYIGTVLWRSYDICQHYRPSTHSLQLCYLSSQPKWRSFNAPSARVTANVTFTMHACIHAQTVLLLIPCISILV